MRITYLPHALKRMRERGISEEDVEAVIEAPGLECPGDFGRTVAERILPGRRLATSESSLPWSGEAHTPGGARRRTMTYRFEHDPESGAFYFHVRDGEYHETIPLGEPGFGAGVDVDAEGNVLGFEFLSFAEYAELVESTGGALEVPDRIRATAAANPDPEALRDAISSLAPREQDLLHLLIWDGLTILEAAERLEISLAVAFRLRSTAFENLRAALYRSTATSEADRYIEEALSKLVG